MSNQKFMSFIDESGVANLNSLGDTFLLSTVTIDKKDFEIIEGYLRLVKRKFLNDDFATLHATDLFERYHTAYPQLKNGHQANAFIHEIANIIGAIPFDCRVYYVNKDALRTRHGYTPARGKTSTSINIELPYEIAAMQAINDFTEYLVEHDAKGEIIIESRLFNDTQFVQTFDAVRKQQGPGGQPQPLHNEVNKRVTSLLIANKDQQNGGLELADLCAYVVYRNKKGDPGKRMSVSQDRVNYLYGIIKNHAVKGATERTKKLIHELNP